MLKRLFDIIISSVIILVLLIPMFIVVIFIKVESKGPILFKQKRVGKNGKYFEIYKFRSMYVETPNVATDKLGDPSAYITRIGKFIRKTSVDELPQLFNIIKGDMSIVGPRPALYNQYELNEMREKKGIHKVRPGLTGYSQIMGRDLISDVKKVEYDNYYVENMGPWFDLKIICSTFFRVLKSEGIRMK